MPHPIIIHISDLHLSNAGESDTRVRKLLARRLGIDGLLGHSHVSLCYLDDFLYAKVQEESDICLVVTGDLTATGHEEEFEIANKFLSAEYCGVGLNVGDWIQRAVPGNHDHWPGRPIIIGRPTPGLEKYFPDLPYAGPVIQLGNGRQLRFLRIDSDDGVNPYLQERWFAIGSFERQLEALSEMLEPLGRNDNEIRVLCLHHSATYRGIHLEANSKSRAALYKFLLRNHIAVVLTGHIHRPPWVRTFPATQPMAPGRTVVIEAKCGTTTQWDPTILREAEFEDSQHWQNSLIVHWLSEADGQIHWNSEIQLLGRTGFDRADRLKPWVDASATFKVWPWPPQGIQRYYGPVPVKTRP